MAASSLSRGLRGRTHVDSVARQVHGRPTRLRAWRFPQPSHGCRALGPAWQRLGNRSDDSSRFVWPGRAPSPPNPPAPPGRLHSPRERPCTSLARTLLDPASVASPRELERAIDRAERQDLFDLTAVQSVLSRARGRRGATALRNAVAAWRPLHTRSELESRFYELMEAAALPRPQLNVLLEGERRVHEVDAHWPAHIWSWSSTATIAAAATTSATPTGTPIWSSPGTA
jgi:hypothetical protein